MNGRLCLLSAFSILFQPGVSAQAQPQDSYKKWLNEDVRWIATSRERAAFTGLKSDTQRDDFIVAFWERRNPTPGSTENPFKMEHYRRIAYANMHFAGKMPGWRTDRGRIYIVYGPPDAIDFHGSNPYQLASGVKASTDPFEVWHYKSIAGFGSDVTVRFVDKCRCGDYRQVSAPSDEHELPLPDSPVD